MASDDTQKPGGSGEPETIFDLHPRQAAPPAESAPQAAVSQPLPAAPPEPDYQTRSAPPLRPLPQQPRENKTPDSTDASRYDFFLGDKPSKKKPAIALPGGGNSRFMRIIVIGVGFFLLLGLLVIIMSLFRSGSNKANANLSSLVVTQQEIIRLSDGADEHLKTTAMKNFAKTARNTTITDQQELKTYLAQHGIKINEKQLEASADPENDKVLSAADAADTYDSSYKTLMGEILSDYRASMQNLVQSAATVEERDILSKDIDSVQLLQNMTTQQ